MLREGTGRTGLFARWLLLTSTMFGLATMHTLGHADLQTGHAHQHAGEAAAMPVTAGEAAAMRVVAVTATVSSVTVAVRTDPDTHRPEGWRAGVSASPCSAPSPC